MIKYLKTLSLAVLVIVGCSSNPAISLAEEAFSAEEAIRLLGNRSQELGTRIIRFSEKRVFPFRSKSAEVEGVVRLSESVGVSIEYPDKEAVLIVDEEGLIMRRLKENGKTRERHMKVEDNELAGLMAALMSFDEAKLEDAFLSSLEGNREKWVLTLTPRNGEGGKVVSARLHSDSESVQQIQIELKGSRRIEIDVVEEKLVEGFSETEQRKYFRQTEAN